MSDAEKKPVSKQMLAIKKRAYRDALKRLPSFAYEYKNNAVPEYLAHLPEDDELRLAFRNAARTGLIRLGSITEEELETQSAEELAEISVQRLKAAHPEFAD